MKFEFLGLGITLALSVAVAGAIEYEQFNRPIEHNVIEFESFCDALCTVTHRALTEGRISGTDQDNIINILATNIGNLSVVIEKLVAAGYQSLVVEALAGLSTG